MDKGGRSSLDSAGNLYLVGESSSVDFPTTPGAFDRNLAQSDLFVAKLDVTGGLAYATFLGGSGPEEADRDGGKAKSQGQAARANRRRSRRADKRRPKAAAC